VRDPGAAGGRADGALATVPQAVRKMAEHFPVGVDVQRRLLTDARMRSVWVSLRRASVTREAIDKLESSKRLSSYGVEMLEWRSPAPRPNDEFWFTLEDEACAAFFATAAVELTFPRPAVMRAEIGRQAERHRDAAALLHAKSHETADPELAGMFAAVAVLLERDAREIEERKDAHVLDYSKKNDELRIRVRRFATQARRIFGKYRRGTIATVASVALKQGVSERDVRNWCADLHAEPRPAAPDKLS
jgi:hypothetical protein